MSTPETPPPPYSTEDELRRSIEQRNHIILGQNHTIAEQNRTIAEQNRILAEQNRILARQNRTIKDVRGNLQVVSAAIEQHHTTSDVRQHAFVPHRTIAADERAALQGAERDRAYSHADTPIVFDPRPGTEILSDAPARRWNSRSQRALIAGEPESLH